MQKITEQEVNPQPKSQPLSCYRGEDEYGPDSPGWYYQAAETEGVITYNAPHLYNDPDAPGRVGEVYQNEIITRVHTRTREGIVYWVVYTEALQASVDLQTIKDRLFWASESIRHGYDDIPVKLLVSDIYNLLAVVEGAATVENREETRCN